MQKVSVRDPRTLEVSMPYSTELSYYQIVFDQDDINVTEYAFAKNEKTPSKSTYVSRKVTSCGYKEAADSKAATSGYKQQAPAPDHGR